MSKLITQCPSCSSGRVAVAKIQCLQCETKFEGNFEIPSLLKIQGDDLQFILDFVRCSGSLKEMAKLHGVSYPTLRNKLNSIIEQINSLENKKVDINDKILKQLEAGEISAKEAARLLKEV